MLTELPSDAPVCPTCGMPLQGFESVFVGPYVIAHPCAHPLAPDEVDGLRKWWGQWWSLRLHVCQWTRFTRDERPDLVACPMCGDRLPWAGRREVGA